jgi:hypothetical protein
MKVGDLVKLRQEMFDDRSLDNQLWIVIDIVPHSHAIYPIKIKNIKHGNVCCYQEHMLLKVETEAI